MFFKFSPRNISCYRKLLPFVQLYRSYVIGISVSLTLAAVTLLSFGVGIKYLIDRGFAPHDQTLLNQAVLILLSISGLMAFASYSRYYLSSLFAEKVIVDVKRTIFNHLILLSPSFFEKQRVGDLLSRFSADAISVQTALGAYASTGMRSLFQFIGALSMLFYTAPKLTGFVFVIIPFVSLPIFSISKKVKLKGRKTQDSIGSEGAFIEETLNAIRTIQAFCRESLHRHIFDQSLMETLVASKGYISLRAVMVAYVIVIVFASISFLLWVGGHEVIQGNLTPGDLSAFVFFGVIAAASVNSLLELSGNIQRAMGALDRLFEILEVEPEIMDAAKTYTLPNSAKGSLKIQSLTFQYPTRLHNPALNQLSFNVNPGEKVAIVGPSGAGKTTLLNLILRFYDPQSGGVNLDEIDIRQLSLEDLRSHIALVPQDPYIFNASVYDNIAYGRYRASREDVHRAAELAYAAEFIDTLPQKYNTILGEKGVRLSGGQKQRLAIARAILKNPLVLLLDEATNALDAHSEHMVQKALEEVMTDRTTLIVAHRLSTVQTADRIIVLNEGKIIASGSHEKLMGEDGLYQRLAQLQFGT